MPNDDLAKLKIDRGAESARGRRSRAWRWVAAAIAVAAVAAIAYRLTHPVPRVAVITVSRVYPSQTFTALNASGYVVAQRKAAVASKTSGRLVWLGVEEGSVVKEGQVIARLESDDLRATEQQARAGVAVARSNRETARAQRDVAAAAQVSAQAQRAGAVAGLDQAQAELDDATIALERQRKLFNGGMTAKVDFDVAETRWRKAQAGVAAARHTVEAADSALRSAADSLAAAESALAAAGHSVESAKAGLGGAEVNAGYAEIRAPFDGVVLTKNADVGDMVTPIGASTDARAAVVTMADPTSLLIEADVSETSLPKVRVGQPCEVQLDSIPDARFPGVVHMIVPTADRAKGTVLAKVRLTALDPRILPEMSAKVAFLERPVAGGETAPRVAVSPKAVAQRGGGSVVFVVRDGRAAAVTVTPGPKLGDMVEIRSGLAGGERAILDPPARLRDGDKVTVAEQ
ncbi:MAG TPA: efflux RND transporter periplasmic adaptor subunit [bacterium]